MFSVPRPTPYDWNFTVQGVRVRVNPWFWLIAAMIGWQVGQRDPTGLLFGIAIVFGSILAHELGHALTGRRYGSRPEGIILYGFGGLALPTVRLPAKKRMREIAAGPAVSLALGVISFLLLQIAPRGNLALVLYFSFWINLIWGLFNLVPVWPLDGGQMMEAYFEQRGPNALGRTLFWTVRVGGGMAILCLFFFHQPFIAIVYGILAYQAHQMRRRPPGPSWRI